jgi:signal transduction histidine kinase
MNVKVGKTGYVYVLDSKGNYIISKDGKRDGENLWTAKDVSGKLFIQDICNKAVILKSTDTAEQRYPWKNDSDSLVREKVVRIKYFKDWDWVIGVGSYTDEFYEARDKVSAIGRHNNIILISISIVSLLFSVITWWLTSNGLIKKIVNIINELLNGSQQVASASQQVSAASQSLAEHLQALKKCLL